MAMSTILPLNIGVIADPSSLVLTYAYENKDVKKFRRRKMPLRDFSEKSDVVKVAFAIKQRHSEYLHDVHLVTIEKLLRIIQEILKGLDRSAAVVKVNEEFNIDPEEDLNKLSIKDLIRKKELMDEVYNKSVVRPDDPDFIYDKEVNFDKIESTSQQYNTDWDDDETSATEFPDKSIKTDNVENMDSLKHSEVSGGASERSRLYEVEDTVGSPSPEDLKHQFIPLVISSKIQGRNKSLFEKASPIKLDELDDVDVELGLGDLEIETAEEPIELDDDDFW